MIKVFILQFLSIQYIIKTAFLSFKLFPPDIKLKIKKSEIEHISQLIFKAKKAVLTIIYAITGPN